MTQTPAKKKKREYFQDFETESFFKLLPFVMVCPLKRKRQSVWTRHECRQEPLLRCYGSPTSLKARKAAFLTATQVNLLLLSLKELNEICFAVLEELLHFCGVRQEDSCSSVDQGFFLFLQETI